MSAVCLDQRGCTSCDSTNELDCGDGVTGVHLCRNLSNYTSEVHAMYCRPIIPPQSTLDFIYYYYDDCVCTSVHVFSHSREDRVYVS